MFAQCVTATAQGFGQRPRHPRWPRQKRDHGDTDHSDHPDHSESPAPCSALTTQPKTYAAPEIWPDNLLIFRVFQGMTTQWHVGMSGPTGLVYASLDRVERACQVSAEQSGEVFAGVQIMERSMLKAWASKKPIRETDAAHRR